jgi:N-dimethylarginine dimethylaminohydrolase
MGSKGTTPLVPGNGKRPGIAIVWEPSSSQDLYQRCITKGRRRQVRADRAKAEWLAFKNLCLQHFEYVIQIPPLEQAPSVDYQFVMDLFGPTINDGAKNLVLTTVPTEKRQWEVRQALSIINSVSEGEIMFLTMDDPEFASKMRDVLEATFCRRPKDFPLVGASLAERKLISELFDCDFFSPADDLKNLNYMIDGIAKDPEYVCSEGGDFMWGWLPSDDKSPGRRRRTALVGVPKNLQTARTNLQGCRRFVLAMLAQGERVLPIAFDNTGDMLHLSTAFGILGANRNGRQGMVINPASIDAKPLRTLGYEVLEVDAEHDFWSAGGFAGFIANGGSALLPQQFPRTISMVEEAGFSVQPITTEETSQIDGSLNCWIRVVHPHPTVN